MENDRFSLSLALFYSSDEVELPQFCLNCKIPRNFLDNTLIALILAPIRLALKPKIGNATFFLVSSVFANDAKYALNAPIASAAANVLLALLSTMFAFALAPESQIEFGR